MSAKILASRWSAVVLAISLPAIAFSAPVVWSGFDHAFVRPDDVNGADPMYRDPIASQVALARADTRGLYNIAIETAYGNQSPAGTRWATELVVGNADMTIAASNWQQLSFDAWRIAYGDSGNLAANIVGRNAVVHLIADDIYLDLRFTSWSQRIGGGFAYLRAAQPAPTLLGDYNENDIVDAADFTVWRDTLGVAVPEFTGADGDGNGIIDTGDYDVWRTHFGQIASSGQAADSSSTAAAIEPSTLTVLFSGMLATFWRGRVSGSRTAASSTLTVMICAAMDTSTSMTPSTLRTASLISTAQ